MSACEDGIHGFLPSRAMCTDNAAMVAAAGWWRLQSDGPTPLDCGADPNLRLPVLGLRLAPRFWHSTVASASSSRLGLALAT